MSFILYVVMAAWQDGRKRAVSGWVFLFFFVHFLTSQICQKVFPVNMDQMPAAFWYQGMAVGTKMSFLWMGSLIGVVLLIISKCSGGALGEGDGIFFVITGIYLGFWRNMLLFFSALFFSSFFGLVFLLWGRMAGKDYRKKKLPFLVFTLPLSVYLAGL